MLNYNYEQASFFFNKSIDFNRNYDVRNAQSAALKLSRVYLSVQDYAQAKKTIEFLNQSLDSGSNAEIQLDYKKLQIDYLHQIGRHTDANKLLPEYLTKRDKLYASKTKLKKIDAPTALYNLQKDYDLNLLKNENKLRTLYLLISLGFVSMLFLILYQIWKNWINSKKNNRTLIELNKQVTEQNLNLQDALMALEQSEEENKKIMRIIAHDLRSPIGAIVSLVGLMEEDSLLNHSEKHSLDLIKLSAVDSLKFINELLNRESADKHLAKEPVELDTLLKYCINQLKYKAEEKKQVIELESRPIIININREKIWRVISNLVTNAIKFSKPNEKIKVWIKSSAERVLISVKDHGIGMPDEIKAKIFNPSADVKRTGTNGEKSYGIGLLISKQIIEAHGGLIWFESTPEIGTTFFVELPIN
ncbi:sensor histidine kinase [Pedobacter sp.]|uniref:sensor histidine kinase n=1 Tax=Pedobacter sp. TaxID=1411316 RepID=UPI003BAB2775